MLTSLVKYAFLPIFAAIVCYVIWRIYVTFATDKKSPWQHLLRGYQKILPATRIVLLLLLLASAGMFVESYGVNVVRYKTPTPECNQVLSIPECTAYGAWNRNYTYELAKVGKTDWNPLSFSVSWVRTMMLNLVFTLNGSQSGFAVGNPLPLPHFIAWGVFFSGVPLLIFYSPKIFRNKTLRLLLLVTIFYLIALWLQNFSDYQHLGQEVAIQGRYLLPILPFIYLMIGLAFGRLFRSRPQLKVALAGVATLCLVIGGGALTFILHSDASWYWPNQSKITNVNQTVQNVLDPVIPGARDKFPPA